MSELNDAVNVTVQDSDVITVPIDDTLTHSGEAADAKAVGDALSQKADKSELQNAVTVNGQAADAQGQIIVTAEDTKISDSDNTTVKAAIEAAAGRTAEDIPMSGSPTAQTIAQAMAGSVTRTADQIAMSASDSTTVKARMDTQQESIEDLQETVGELDQRTGASIPYRAGSAETIKEHVDAMEAEKVKTVNEIGPDANGNIALERVPYADNLYSEDADQVDGSFIIRTTGGSGSLSDGSAWAQSIRGNRIREGYVQERVQMTVTPMPRTAPAAITAVLNESVFEEYVGTAGTYVLEYADGSWSSTPSDFGLTISNDPLDGDKITIVWDGTNDAVMTVSAVERPVPPAITATIDRDTFVAYVTESGTTTLTYTTAWSADPALYGITVTGTPIAGDQISVVYVKEVRGTITVATPSRLVATGWNLYRQGLNRARVVRYSDLHGYKIGGSFTALAFAETLTGTQTAITPDANGLFQVPADGYVFVTGGGADTYILTTWSDWESGYVGDFASYTESAVDLSTIMTAYFPYGLCRVGDVRDEIDLRHKVAINRIQRMEYSAANRASAEASGRDFEFDEDYIYIVRESETTTDISLEEEYSVNEHGLEFFDGATVPVYAEILYGVNLKDKLKRDVVTISEQTLSAAQQAQVRENIGAANTTGVQIANADDAPLGLSCISESGTNSPFSFWASLYTFVGGNPNYLQQIAYPWSVVENRLAYRVKDGGVWENWHYYNDGSDVGIVENGVTATHGIAAGQYVIWKGVLYKANSAIPVGGTLSSYLSAVANGLGAEVASLNSNYVNKNSPVVNGTIADSRMPSTNRQLINYSGGSVYLGNPTNVSDVFIQDTSGTTSVNDVNSKLTNGSWTTVTVNSSTNYTVPDNGVLYFSAGSASTSPEYIIYTISDWRTIRINVYNGFTETKYVPVAKGDIIKFSSQSANVSNVLVQYRKMY